MILVDTSVWVDHLRFSESILVELLKRSNVFSHSFVIGELACGNLRNRQEILGLLHNLPQAPMANDAEVLLYIENKALMGCGIGYIDVHLLASTSLAAGTQLWTRDKHLEKVARALSLAYV